MINFAFVNHLKYWEGGFEVKKCFSIWDHLSRIIKEKKDKIMSDKFKNLTYILLEDTNEKKYIEKIIRQVFACKKEN